MLASGHACSCRPCERRSAFRKSVTRDFGISPCSRSGMGRTVSMRTRPLKLVSLVAGHGHFALSANATCREIGAGLLAYRDRQEVVRSPGACLTLAACQGAHSRGPSSETLSGTTMQNHRQCVSAIHGILRTHKDFPSRRPSASGLRHIVASGQPAQRVGAQESS